MRTTSLSCLKYFMFLFNLLLFICGAALLGIGIWAAADGQSFKEILVENPIIFNGVYLIIGVGAILFLLGFLGCCGAAKENKCLLGMFFFFVLVIFVVEIVGAILVFVYLPQINDEARKSINQYETNSTTGKLITHGWNTLQITVGCCGYNNYTDWNIKPTLPTSCCKRDSLSVDGIVMNLPKCEARDMQYIYTEGCEAKLSSYIWAIGGAALGFLLLEILTMIVTCCLYKNISDNHFG